MGESMKSNSGNKAAWLIGLVALIALATPVARAQEQQKDSLWKKLQKAAQGANTNEPSNTQPKPQTNASGGHDANNASASSNSSSSEPAPNPQGGAKVEQKLVAPYQPQSTFYISPKGVHVASVDQSGSRPAVIYDGAEGPKFDQI